MLKRCIVVVAIALLAIAVMAQDPAIADGQGDLTQATSGVAQVAGTGINAPVAATDTADSTATQEVTKDPLTTSTAGQTTTGHDATSSTPHQVMAEYPVPQGDVGEAIDQQTSGAFEATATDSDAADTKKKAGTEVAPATVDEGQGDALAQTPEQKSVVAGEAADTAQETVAGKTGLRLLSDREMRMVRCQGACSDRHLVTIAEKTPTPIAAMGDHDAYFDAVHVDGDATAAFEATAQDTARDQVAVITAPHGKTLVGQDDVTALTTAHAARAAPATTWQATAFGISQGTMEAIRAPTTPVTRPADVLPLQGGIERTAARTVTFASIAF